MDQENETTVRPADTPRADWAIAFKKMAEQRDDVLLDEETASLSDWDIAEWEW